MTIRTHIDNDYVVVKLHNRRIYLMKKNGDIFIIFHSLQNEADCQTPYFDNVSVPKFGKCVAEKVLRITEEASLALMQSLIVFHNPNTGELL